MRKFRNQKSKNPTPPPLPCPAPDACVLYLVRHGATANNIALPQRLQGRRSDPELSAEGILQSAAVARFFAARPLHCVYSSPLLRARQTAEAIALPHKLPVVAVEALTECDVGDWEGCSWGEIERREPAAYRRFMSDPATHPYAGGENLEQVLERAAPAFADLAASHLGQAIVVVTHKLVLRTWLASCSGMPLAKARSIEYDTCGVSLLNWTNGNAEILALNFACGGPEARGAP